MVVQITVESVQIHGTYMYISGILENYEWLVSKVLSRQNLEMILIKTNPWKFQNSLRFRWEALQSPFQPCQTCSQSRERPLKEQLHLIGQLAEVAWLNSCQFQIDELCKSIFSFENLFYSVYINAVTLFTRFWQRVFAIWNSVMKGKTRKHEEC